LKTKSKLSKTRSNPGVKRLLEKAIEWKGLLDSGKVRNKAEIARQEGFSRARVTQIMKLLALAPEIQNYILSLPETSRRPAITERSLRHITRLENHVEQKKVFLALFDFNALSKSEGAGFTPEQISRKI